MAVPVTDLKAAREFYCGLLGCQTGREASRWVDLDFFDHQVTLHLVDESPITAGHNDVDNESVPAPHFGIILPLEQWQELASKLQSAAVDFIIKPGLRFAGEVGEQWTLFLRDPSGNAIEFKAFADDKAVFRSDL